MKHVKLFESWINEEEEGKKPESVAPQVKDISKMTIGEFDKLPLIDKKDVMQSIFDQFSYESGEKPIVMITPDNTANPKDEVVISIESYNLTPISSEKNLKTYEVDKNSNIFEMYFRVTKGSSFENVGPILLYMDYLRKDKRKIRADFFQKNINPKFPGGKGGKDLLTLNGFTEEVKPKEYFADNKDELLVGTNSLATFAQKFYKAAVAKRKKKEEA